MVALSPHLNFTGTIDDFLRARPLTGEHKAILTALIHERANTTLAHPDIRYMPSFKILDLIADMVNQAGLLDAEPQLRAVEATALFTNSFHEESPRIHRFLLDAALERARYEPMMILDTTAATLREKTLRKRWAAMRHAHQRRAKLPDAYIDVLNARVEAAITAPEFANFRIGPLMQLFAEMLDTARVFSTQSASPESLITALSPNGSLWKRYALKPQRYKQKSAVSPFPAPPADHRIH